MSSKTLKMAKDEQDHLFNEISVMLSALASPVRLRIIHFLSQAPHSVEQLSLKLDQSVANTSMHLKKMQREDLLSVQVIRQKRLYSLAHNKIKDFWESVQDLSETLHPDYIMPTQLLYPEQINWQMDLNQTIKMIKSKKILLLDIRPLDEIDDNQVLYKKYVIHIPYSQLKERYQELTKTKTILIICRGRLCALSGEFTDFLSKLDYKVFKAHFSWHQISKNLEKEDL